MKRNKKIEKGFTFIELLIGLVIMGIMFTIGFASYRNFASRQNIEGLVREIKGDLRLAQQMATSGVKSTDETSSCHTDKVLEGYIVRYESDTSYAIYANCDGENLIKEVNFVDKYPNMVISDFNFTFLPLAQGINISGPPSITVREIVEGVTVSTRTITVTLAGQIN